MAGTGNDKSKRAFDFKMSKKVAELTQVVHMLFTRNHEKEVELDALKEAYEFEISEVMTDAKNKLSQLEKQVEDLTKQQELDSNKIRKLQEDEFRNKERELKTKLEESERLLQEERTECQNLRDMLIRAQRDIENLRHGVSQQITSQTDEVTKRDREIERLKKHMSQLEQSLKDCGKESNELIKELEKNNEGLERELRHVHSALEESHRTRDQLLLRTKQLEADSKALKRDFNRKVTEVVNGQKLQRNNVDLSAGSQGDYNEELERLKREIQRYRLELSNRDANFNRMFTEKQPIHLDRANSVGPGSGFKLNTGTGFRHPNGLNNVVAMRRERTLSRISSGPVLCFDDSVEQAYGDQRQRSASTPSSQVETRTDSRFPSICSTPDIKPRKPASSRLVKPKPLPKEMLYGK